MNWISDDTTVVQLLTALLTPTIAIFGAYVAWAQWDTNKANLKEKLFERRFAVFKSTQKLLSDIIKNDEFPTDSYGDFVDALQKSRFLFGRSFQIYLEEIRKRTARMDKYDKQLLGKVVSDERTRIVELRYAESEWLNDQVSIIFDRFDPYIGFEKYQ